MTTDVFTPEQRSAVMRAVKAAGTGPERRLLAALKALGLSPQVQARDLAGSPDFAFRRDRVAVFVHGCFWHGHDCARGARAPKSNAAYWAAKIARNRRRDRAAARALRAQGFSVFTVWECRMKDAETAARRLARRIRA